MAAESCVATAECGYHRPVDAVPRSKEACITKLLRHLRASAVETARAATGRESDGGGRSDISCQHLYRPAKHHAADRCIINIEELHRCAAMQAILPIFHQRQWAIAFDAFHDMSIGRGPVHRWFSKCAVLVDDSMPSAQVLLLVKGIKRSDSNVPLFYEASLYLCKI